MADLILVETKGHMAILTLNRPDHLNAFTCEMIRGVEEETAAIRDNPDIRAVLVTGAGSAFCAGVDLHEKSYNPLNSRIFLKTFNRMLNALEMLPQPTVAAINGAAVAGGLELALACTFRIASTEAKLGLPEIKLGLVAAAGATQRLPRLVGFGQALEMCLLGELLSGQSAADCGLVNRAVAPQKLLPEALALARRLADNAPVAMSLVKDALYAAAAPHHDMGSLLEILSASVNHFSEDKKEGLAAFFAKRKPHFRGK